LGPKSIVSTNKLFARNMAKKLSLLLSISSLVAIAGYLNGLTFQQAFIVCIFSLSILGTLFFWDFRLSFVFIGSGILFLTKSVNLEEFIKSASLDVILFLIGMMIVVGAMKESGVFHWLVGMLLKIKNLNASGLFVIIMTASAVLSALTGEITSIIVMMAIILDVGDSLKINPVPLVISSVLTTNIGSASTVLGNPIGILIALRGNLTFEDFLTRALPLSVVILIITMLTLGIWYRSYIKEISSALAALGKEERVSRSVFWDRDKRVSTAIFSLMIVLITLHKRLEVLFGIEENSLLIILPVIFAGVVMLYRHDKVQYYIEREVEWTSLLFFMFLFAQAGVIQSSGVAQFFAGELVANVGNQPKVLSAIVLFSSGILSGMLDNTVVVASYIPMVNNLHMLHSPLQPLWWAMLFGACLGGNITAIGSTANIVALGVLEKQRSIKINFFEWLKLGLTVGIISMLIAYFAIVLVPIFSK